MFIVPTSQKNLEIYDWKFFKDPIMDESSDEFNKILPIEKNKMFKTIKN